MPGEAGRGVARAAYLHKILIPELEIAVEARPHGKRGLHNRPADPAATDAFWRIVDEDLGVRGCACKLVSPDGHLLAAGVWARDRITKHHSPVWQKLRTLCGMDSRSWMAVVLNVLGMNPRSANQRILLRASWGGHPNKQQDRDSDYSRHFIPQKKMAG